MEGASGASAGQDRPSPHTDDCCSCGAQQHGPSAARWLKRRAGSDTFPVPGVIPWEQKVPYLVHWWEGALRRQRRAWIGGNNRALGRFQMAVFSHARNCRWKSKMRGTNKISLSDTARVGVVNLLKMKGLIVPHFVSWFPTPQPRKAHSCIYPNAIYRVGSQVPCVNI